ncbi:transmembrane protein 151B [Patella vulgata]|uniref:transmembrane protein 151B n=1 Tax=Patella vulgata TaxID=6465 RepID=UPI00217F4772|nr:transmembrane protein 151B [Patella vulgata]
MQTDDSATETEQRPIKQSFCGSLRRDAHWKCLILTLLICGCLASVAWCRFAVVETVVVDYYSLPAAYIQDKTSPCNDGYIYIPVAFVIMLYLVYLVECWHSHTRIELQYKVDINSVYDRVTSMKEAIPIIWWKAICYHYIRRTRQVTRYRNGDAFTSTQIYYERVNSCTAGSAFNFSQCGVKDISKKLCGLADYPATKIRFSKGFSFATIEAECEFEDQRAQFFQDYESRDDYMEGREGMDLLNVNFKEYMIAFADPDNLPWYVSHVIFWVASFLLLSWPLRVIIEFKTAHLHYHVHKLFGVNYVNTGTMPRPISRVTINSTDIEMNIRNNNALVPSYSEAILMDLSRSRYMSDTVTGTSSGNETPRSFTFSAFPPSRSTGFLRSFFSSNNLGTSHRRSNSYSGLGENIARTYIRSENRGTSEIFNFAKRWRRRVRRKRGTGSSSSTRNDINTTSPTSQDEYYVTIDPAASTATLSSRVPARTNTIYNPRSTENIYANITRPRPLPSVRPPIRHEDSETSVSLARDAPPCYEDAVLVVSESNLQIQDPVRLGEEANENETEHSQLIPAASSSRQYLTFPCMETSL